MTADILPPWVHRDMRTLATLKTWALSVHHDLRRPRLQAYLVAFVSRLNRRRTRHAAFRNLLLIGASTTLRPTTF